MKNFFKDSLKLRFIFLITQTLLCNAILLLAVSHFLTFMVFNNFIEGGYNSRVAYGIISGVLLIFSMCFIILNKHFYHKYEFYRVTIAEKILARNGLLTAQFIRPSNIKVETKVELGSLTYHKSIKEISNSIDIVMRNGRIVLSENGDLDTKFYIYGRDEANVKIAHFKVDNIKELRHQKEIRSSEPESN
jgi:hypothetical protein